MRRAFWLWLALVIACGGGDSGGDHQQNGQSAQPDGDDSSLGDSADDGASSDGASDQGGGNAGDGGDGSADGSQDGNPDGDQDGSDGSADDGTGDDGADDDNTGDGDDEVASDRRPLRMTGRAISYSPYRAGQSPDTGVGPSSAQILEDLQILARHWQNIRTYGGGQVTRDIVRLIAEHNLPIKVMLGAWLVPENSDTDRQRNEAETDDVLRIAADYPGVVGAISVGNEALVDWSTHKVPLERVIYFVRKVRAATDLPVTTADNYVWWREYGATLAAEVDFIVIHTYPFWENYDIDLRDPNDRRAIDYTKDNYYSVKRRRPGLPIVIGEAGWATADNGSWNPQIVEGAGSQEKQKVYYEQLMEWTEQEGILTFVFEAFDEKWKGGPDAVEPEKHWGLFFENRTPKLVMKDLFSDLQPTKL